MICPLKFNENTVDSAGVYGGCECEKADCGWWNERFGMCSQSVDAYLKGQEDWHKEKELIRRGG